MERLLTNTVPTMTANQSTTTSPLSALFTQQVAEIYGYQQVTDSENK
jgi:hypothetical protein